MIILEGIQQKTPEWYALDGKYFRASECAAMMGDDPHMTRDAMIRKHALGETKEFSDWVQQNLLDKGHEVEASARAILEEREGVDLYTITVTDDSDTYMASLDGMPIDGNWHLENKLWNQALAEAIRRRDLPARIYWQCEHQLLCTGNEFVRVVCSDGTVDNWVEMDYYPVPGRRQKLVAGWHQFGLDVKNYRHQPEVIPATAKAVMALPSLHAQIEVGADGKIAVVTNIDKFGERLLEYVNSVNATPDDDQGFVDCDKAAKVLKEAEQCLDNMENHALAQIEAVEVFRRTKANYSEIARTNRLVFDKAATQGKESKKSDIRSGGVDAWDQHMAALSTQVCHPMAQHLRAISPDFAKATKGLKTISSLRNAVNTALAKAKIEAAATAETVATNLSKINVLAGDYAHLFKNVADIVAKPTPDFEAIVKTTVAEAKAAEAERLEPKLKRIRAEEEAKARSEAEAKVRAEQEADRQRTDALAKEELDHNRLMATAHSPTAPPPQTPVASGQSKIHTLPPHTPPAARKTRPADDEIITVLSRHYSVDECVALAWLLGMDLQTASKRMTTQFAGA